MKERVNKKKKNKYKEKIIRKNVTEYFKISFFLFF